MEKSFGALRGWEFPYLKWISDHMAGRWGGPIKFYSVRHMQWSEMIDSHPNVEKLISDLGLNSRDMKLRRLTKTEMATEILLMLARREKYRQSLGQRSGI